MNKQVSLSIVAIVMMLSFIIAATVVIQSAAAAAANKRDIFERKVTQALSKGDQVKAGKICQKAAEKGATPGNC